MGNKATAGELAFRAGSQTAEFLWTIKITKNTSVPPVLSYGPLNEDLETLTGDSSNTSQELGLDILPKRLNGLLISRGHLILDETDKRSLVSATFLLPDSKDLISLAVTFVPRSFFSRFKYGAVIPLKVPEGITKEELSELMTRFGEGFALRFQTLE